jgi:tetratricopeptide (TPR) repeat protein
MPETGTARDKALAAPVRVLVAFTLAALGLLNTDVGIRAADTWIEMKSKNFTAVSNAGERSTRNLLWQLEQMRAAMRTLWAWARADLNQPLTVIVLKDENSMRAFAPEYWEKRGLVHPASLWAGGADQHFLVMRTDVQIDDQAQTNPYFSSYFSYAGLILGSSTDRALPYWVERGLTGVLSNTMVRSNEVRVGPIVPMYLQNLREEPRLPLAKLLAMARRSPELRQSEFLRTFDAQTWALVHCLIFGENGKRAPQLDAFVKMVGSGKEAAAAFTEAFGPLDGIDLAFRLYLERNVYQYRRITVDVGVERERFPVRVMSPAESASARALFHAAMQRPVESRSAIAEARKADPKSADSYTAEGLLLDREQKRDDAKAAFAKAVELGTPSAYAHFRLASLNWQPRPSQDSLKEIEALLAKAIELNIRYAWAYGWLGEVRAALGSPSGIGLIRRAIVLDPREPAHRLRAARVLLNSGQPGEARQDAQAALALAEDDEDKKEAQVLLDRIAKFTER